MIFWIASYPKSGNTWFRVFLANLFDENAVPVDINRLGAITNFDDRKNFDAALGWETSELPINLINSLRPAVQESLPGAQRKFFKAHEAYMHPETGISLFSERATSGAFYIVRNPLDVASSFANHLGSDVDAAIALMNLPGAHLKQSSQLPQPMGSWSWHVKSWVDASNIKVHILRYEDMLHRPDEVFTSACRFADFRVSPKEISRALERSCFETLQEQEKASGFKEKPQKCPVFFRSGCAGSWRHSLTEAQVEAIVGNHRDMMRRFGYLDTNDSPVFP